MRFRAWDDTKGRYTSQNDKLAVTFDGHIVYLDGDCKDKCTTRNDLILQESFNICDNDGVEIFEGDILYDESDDEFYKLLKDRAGCFCTDSALTPMQIIDYIEDFKVVGNEFEGVTHPIAIEKDLAIMINKYLERM